MLPPPSAVLPPGRAPQAPMHLMRLTEQGIAVWALSMQVRRCRLCTPPARRPHIQSSAPHPAAALARARHPFVPPQFILWNKSAARLTLQQHIHQELMVLLELSYLMAVLLLPDRVWLPHPVTMLGVARVACALMPCRRSATVGTAVLLQRPVTEGWLGALIDWARVGGGAAAAAGALAGALGRGRSPAVTSPSAATSPFATPALLYPRHPPVCSHRVRHRGEDAAAGARGAAGGHDGALCRPARPLRHAAAVAPRHAPPPAPRVGDV